MAIDGSVEEADPRQVGQLQRSLTASAFARRLSQSGSGANRKQRGYGENCRAHAACEKRSSGEPGAHNESSEIKTVLRNFQTCLGAAFRIQPRGSQSRFRLCNGEHAQSSLEYCLRNSEHASTARPE